MSNPQVTITGRLGKTPELSFTTNGSPRASFSLATSNSKKLPDGSWEDGPASWWNVAAWDKTAENLVESNLTPGTELTVTGELTERTYQKRDGSEARAVELRARTVAVTLSRGPVTVRGNR